MAKNTIWPVTCGLKYDLGITKSLTNNQEPLLDNKKLSVARLGPKAAKQIEALEPKWEFLESCHGCRPPRGNE